MAVLDTILAPSVVTRRISRIYTPGNYLSRHFGMHIGGPNITRVSGRAYSWDIYDNTRAIAQGRAPGTGPAVVAVNPVGRQTNTFPRAYEKCGFAGELLNNIRVIGQNAGVKDQRGATLVDAQLQVEKQKHDNFREFMLAMLLVNGQFSVKFDGDNWTPVASLGGGETGFNVDYLIPSGNKTQLDMLGAGNIIGASWATTTTDIPSHLDGINVAFEQLVGSPLSLVITDAVVWNAVLNNTKLQAQSGSVNAVFAEYDRMNITGPDGQVLNVFKARLKARPWIEWLIVNHGLEVNGTYSRFYGGTKATFLADGWQTWLRGQEGSEIVQENYQSTPTERFGFWSWIFHALEPYRIELHSLQNFIPELTIPKAVAIGTVIT